MKDAVKTVGLMADKAKICYLSYIDGECFPVTRAMLRPREREGVTTFYLSTNTSSNKVANLITNPNASLYFVDTRFYRGVCLTGTAEILTDEESKKRIWRMGDTMYYKKGVTDPDYCVIKFTATRGRYYAGFKNEDFEI